MFPNRLSQESFPKHFREFKKLCALNSEREDADEEKITMWLIWLIGRLFAGMAFDKLVATYEARLKKTENLPWGWSGLNVYKNIQRKAEKLGYQKNLFRHHRESCKNLVGGFSRAQGLEKSRKTQPAFPGFNTLNLNSTKSPNSISPVTAHL